MASAGGSNVSESVRIVEYKPEWRQKYESERANLQRVFRGTDARIEHVGSTAILGLGAKPIIDILIGLGSLQEAEARIPELDALGYEYVPEHEEEFPGRRYFRKPPHGTRNFHLHCVVRDGDFWKRTIAFRDYLGRHPDAAAAYFDLKRELAARFGDDRAGYTEAKRPFIEAMLRKAGLEEIV